MKNAAIITVIYLLLGLLWMFWENHLLFVGVSSVLIFLLIIFFNSKNNSSQNIAEGQLAFELREKNALINSTKEMIWSVDQDMKLRSCNDSFSNTIKAFTGKKINPGDNVLLPEYGEEVLELWTQYYKKVFAGHIINETSIREVNGKSIYSDVSLYPIYDDDRIIGIICYSRDVTQQEETLLAMKTSEKKYRQNLERISSAYASFNNDWCFTYVNQKAAKVWEKEPDYLVGKSAWDEFPEWFDTGFYIALLEAKETGQFVYNETYFEPWDVWFANFIYPDKDGISVFFHDISKQKKAEEQLRHGLMEKNALINSTDDLIWSLDAEMKLLSWNQAFIKRATLISGRKMESGEPVTLVEFGEEIAQTWKMFFERAMKGEIIRKTQRLELNGEASYEEFSLHPIYNEDKIVGVSCFSKNVTIETLAIEGLRESESKYRTLLERITNAMVSYDNDWNYTYVNPKASELLGKDPEYLLGKNVWEVFPEGMGQPFYEALHKAKETQQSIYLELYYEPWDTWYEDYIYPSPEGISVFYNDITPRKKAEEKLRESESMLSRIYDSITDGLGIYEVTESGEFLLLSANETANLTFQLKGKKIHDYIGVGFSQVMQQVWGFSEEEALEMEEDFRYVVQTHNPIQRKAVLPIDGVHFIHIITTLNPVIDEAGVCTHILWIVQDVTQIKANERAIVESREQLDLIYQSTTEMMALLSYGRDRRCFIQSANPPFMEMLRQSFSRAEEVEIKGTPLEEILTGSILVNGSESSRKAISRIYRAAEQKEPENFPMSNLVDGKVRDFEFSVIPILDDSGSTRHLLLVIYDQTERLYEAEKTFMAITSAVEEEQVRLASELHDSLTQTLSVASINLKNLSHDFAEIKDQQKYARALQYLEEGIEESRSIAHRIMPKAIKDFGLIPSVQELIENLGVKKPVITFSYNRMIRLPEEFELNLFRIIQQALSNTLSHASANSFDAALMIKAAFIQLQIKDDGIGFDPEALSGSHEGIGIRTMRARTAQLGGYFKLESQKNKGTIISIKIPMKINLLENEN